LTRWRDTCEDLARLSDARVLSLSTRWQRYGAAKWQVVVGLCLVARPADGDMDARVALSRAFILPKGVVFIGPLGALFVSASGGLISQGLKPLLCTPVTGTHTRRQIV
jgi:hypothetical protein